MGLFCIIVQLLFLNPIAFLDQSLGNIKKSDIIWIISPWVWRKLPKRHLKSKKVICSIYHIDFNKFDEKEKKDFYKRDRFVDAYHVISNKTKDQLKTLTDSTIKVKVPAGTQPGTLINCKGQGMPVHKTLNIRGNLYVKINIIIPELSNEELKKIKDL